LRTWYAWAACFCFEPDFGAFVRDRRHCLGILFLVASTGVCSWMIAAALPVALGAIPHCRAVPPAAPHGISSTLWSDPLGKGYQLSHSLIAFGSRRVARRRAGLLAFEKLLFLPEAIPISCCAVVAEELGFAGVAFVIALFIWLLYRAYAIGRQAAHLERPFARACRSRASAYGSASRRSSTSA
jgi:cell division protein FtsW